MTSHYSSLFLFVLVISPITLLSFPGLPHLSPNKAQTMHRAVSANTMSESDTTISLTDRIIRNVKLKFPETSARVVDCFERFSAGEEVDVMLGGGKSDHNRQKANCFVKGLTTKAFHDTSMMNWAVSLENEAAIVQKELESFIQNNSKGQEGRWLGPRFQGQHYGKQHARHV